MMTPYGKCHSNKVLLLEYNTVKRVGRPRQSWLHYAKKHTFEHILGGYEYEEMVVDVVVDAQIYNAAINRIFNAEAAPRTCGYAHALHDHDNFHCRVWLGKNGAPCV